MPFSLYDPETSRLLCQAFDDALADIVDSPALFQGRKADTMRKMTAQILAAAGKGERDHEKLKAACLEGIERNSFPSLDGAVERSRE